MKIVSAPTTPHTILGTGRKNDNTGIFLQVSNYGRTLVAECIDYSSYVSFQYDVGETLFSWTHIAMVEDRATGKSRNSNLLTINAYMHGYLSVCMWLLIVVSWLHSCKKSCTLVTRIKIQKFFDVFCSDGLTLTF